MSMWGEQQGITHRQGPLWCQCCEKYLPVKTQPEAKHISNPRSALILKWKKKKLVAVVINKDEIGFWEIKQLCFLLSLLSKISVWCRSREENTNPDGWFYSFKRVIRGKKIALTLSISSLNRRVIRSFNSIHGIINSKAFQSLFTFISLLIIFILV